MWPIVVVTCKPINMFVGKWEYMGVFQCMDVRKYGIYFSCRTGYSISHSFTALTCEIPVSNSTQEINYIFPRIHVLFSI